MMKSSQNKGRIVGRSISEIFVRSAAKSSLVLGEILVAGDDDIRFFLRVVDISYGFEQGDTGWAINLAGSMMKMEETGRGFKFFDRDNRSFEMGKCVIMGYTKDNLFKRAKSLPPLFSEVYIPEAIDLDFIREYAGELTVGRLRSGEDVLDLKVGMSKGYIQSHTGIFATTGMGKSNLMKTLAGSVMENRGTGLLIFDPHGEYIDGGESHKKGLKHHPKADDKLSIFSYRELSINYNKLIIGHRELEIDDLQNLMDFSQAQIEAAHALRKKHGKEWLKRLDEQSAKELLDEESSAKFHEMTIAVLQRRANQIFQQNIFHKDDNVSVTEKIIADLKKGMIVLIDLSGLSGWRELLPAAVITRKIFESYRNEFRNPKAFKALPNIAIVLEEAQRVLGQLSRTKDNIFARLCREGRKFKVGMTAITQQPKLIDEEILSQFNTLFILGLADERDRNILRSSSRQDISELSREIQMLQPGEALITSPHTPFAIPAKIDLYEDYLSDVKTVIKDKTIIPSPDSNFF
ncbi:MAG: ATP-binding protein [candidate division Zixibacteria bacterium]|nr:ATP-binding protein [candidate division Zixibacteria bacterium]